MAVTSTIVTQYYTGIFRQAPSAAVSSAYQAMANDAAALNSMLSAANVTVDPVVRLYQTAFNRLPDTNGMTAWVVPFSTGQITLQFIANGFTQSTEFTTLYPTSMSNSQFVGALYWNILQRAGEDAGIKGWTAALDSGALTRAQVLLGFSESAEFTAKIEPSVNQFLTNIANTALANQGNANLYSGSLFDLGGGGALTVYNLTTNVETISGSNIAVNGVVDFGAGTAPVAAGTTYNTADSITGTGGTNILTITLANAATGAINAMNAPTVSGMGTVNVRNVSGQAFFATGAGAYDVANFGSGVTSINSDRSTAAVFLQNIAGSTAVGIIGNGTITNGNLEANYKTSATSNTINVTGGSTAGNITVTGAGITAATINSLGVVGNTLGTITLAATTTSATLNANSGLALTALTAAGLSKLTVTGAAASPVSSSSLSAVNLGGTAGTATVVDASAMTAGGVQLTLNAGTTSFKGGAGNDNVTTAALTTTTAGIIDGGAGTGDRVIIAASTDINTTAKGAQYVNFEIMRNSTTAQQDVSLVAGITSVEANGNGAGFSKLTAAQAAAVTNLVNNASATFALADATGTSDLLSVTLKNATASASASLTNATVTGFESMTVNSASGTAAGTVSTLSFAAAGNLTTLTLTGANALVVDTTNLTKGITIDGSGLTAVPTTGNYNLTLSGNLVKGSVVTGSGAADSITTTAAIAGTTGDFVTYNAGGGNDLITTTIAAINNTSAANGSIKIDGGAGTDTVSTDAGAYTDANFQYITNVEKLTLTGATSFTSGGFFDTNFKAGGVNATNALANGNNTFDLSTFTGVVTATYTQTGAGAVGDVYSLKSGSAADTISFTAGKVLTSTTNVINTNAGADTVNITAAGALGAAGKFTVNLGNDADTLNVSITGAGLLDITGGTGADTFNLGLTVHTGIFNLNQGVGDSGTFVKPTTNSISTTTFDVSASGNIATDTITLANTNPGAIVQATDLSAVVLGNDTITQVKGTYNASSGTFVGAAGGADSLFIYDSTAGATVTYEAIVIVGNGATATAAAGVITLA